MEASHSKWMEGVPSSAMTYFTAISPTLLRTRNQEHPQKQDKTALHLARPRVDTTASCVFLIHYRIPDRFCNPQRLNTTQAAGYWAWEGSYVELRTGTGIRGSLGTIVMVAPPTINLLTMTSATFALSERTTGLLSIGWAKTAVSSWILVQIQRHLHPHLR